jgi:hypothetical protein
MARSMALAPAAATATASAALASLEGQRSCARRRLDTTAAVWQLRRGGGRAARTMSVRQPCIAETPQPNKSFSPSTDSCVGGGGSGGRAWVEASGRRGPLGWPSPWRRPAPIADGPAACPGAPRSSSPPPEPWRALLVMGLLR